MDKPIDKPWDDSLKKLVRANPQAFVLWLPGKADFIKELPDRPIRIVAIIAHDQGWSKS